MQRHRVPKLTVRGCSLGCSSTPCAAVQQRPTHGVGSSLNRSGQLRPELLMRLVNAACGSWAGRPNGRRRAPRLTCADLSRFSHRTGEAGMAISAGRTGLVGPLAGH